MHNFFKCARSHKLHISFLRLWKISAPMGISEMQKRKSNWNGRIQNRTLVFTPLPSSSKSPATAAIVIYLSSFPSRWRILGWPGWPSLASTARMKSTGENWQEEWRRNCTFEQSFCLFDMIYFLLSTDKHYKHDREKGSNFWFSRSLL